MCSGWIVNRYNVMFFVSVSVFIVFTKVHCLTSSCQQLESEETIALPNALSATSYKNMNSVLFCSTNS